MRSIPFLCDPHLELISLNRLYLGINGHGTLTVDGDAMSPIVLYRTVQPEKT